MRQSYNLIVLYYMHVHMPVAFVCDVQLVGSGRACTNGCHCRRRTKSKSVLSILESRLGMTFIHVILKDQHKAADELLQPHTSCHVILLVLFGVAAKCGRFAEH
jgi:hypothetical protein